MVPLNMYALKGVSHWLRTQANLQSVIYIEDLPTFFCAALLDKHKGVISLYQNDIFSLAMLCKPSSKGLSRCIRIAYFLLCCLVRQAQ